MTAGCATASPADRERRPPVSPRIGNCPREAPAAKSTVPELKRLLKDKDPGVRAAAAEVLKKIRGEKSKP